MLVSDAISDINDGVRGQDDTVPEEGSDEWNYWVRTLNRVKRKLYRNVRKRWSNTYEMRSVGNVSASDELVIDLDDDFLAPSDQILVVDLNSGQHLFDVIKPEERHVYSNGIFFQGINPRQLVFNWEITATSQLVGGTVYVSGYWMPDDVAAGTDELPFLSPEWAVAEACFQIAFNDVVYEDKAPDLKQEANQLFRDMDALNSKGTFNNPRRTPTSVYRIRGY